MSNDGLWNQIKGNFEQLKGDLRSKWGELTDNEVQQLKGERDQLAGQIREKYGIAQEEAEKQVDEWAEEIKSKL